jgi:hypothetical protein
VPATARRDADDAPAAKRGSRGGRRESSASQPAPVEQVNPPAVADAADATRDDASPKIAKSAKVERKPKVVQPDRVAEPARHKQVDATSADGDWNGPVPGFLGIKLDA